MDSTDPGANTSSIRIKLLREVSLITFLCLQLASRNVQAICNDGEEIDPQAPDCFDDCQGRRFFLDRDGICKMCVQCEPGFQHDKYCGDGVNGDAICVPCPEDHFSFNLYDCVACRVCENTLITQECTPSTDRQCGECLPGYYRDPQNPDLCNQRCEWLNNPRTIPSCRAWLANQQETTLSADMSQMSSFPMATDQGSGRMSGTLIIIILLIFVLIAGSIIPVYLCCKYYRHDSQKPKEIEAAHPSQESFEATDVFSEDCTNGLAVNGDICACGGNDIGISRTEANGTLRVDNDLLLSTRPEQRVSNFKENKEGDKNPYKSVMDVFESTDEVDSSNDILQRSTGTGMSNSQECRDNSSIPSYSPSASWEESESGNKLGYGISENLTSLERYSPSLDVHSGKLGRPPPDISENLCIPGMSNDPQTIKSKEEKDAKISQEKMELRQSSLETEGGQRGEGGGDNADDAIEEPDEQQRLLPFAALRSTNGAEINQHDKNNKELMLPGLASEVAKDEDEARADEGDDCSEELNKHPKANAGVKDQSGGAEGLDDEEWRGSAEAERSQPIKGKEKKKTSKTQLLQPSSKHGKEKKKKAKSNITLKFIGEINTVVIGNQNHYYSTIARENEDAEEDKEEEEEEEEEEEKEEEGDSDQDD